MPYPLSTKQVVLQNYAPQAVDLSEGSTATFATKDVALPAECPADSLIVQNLYFSNDPGQKLWISGTGGREFRKDFQNLPIGASMESYTLSRVLAVGGDSHDFHVGDLVEVRTAWASYSVVQKAKAKIRRYSYFLILLSDKGSEFMTSIFISLALSQRDPGH